MVGTISGFITIFVIASTFAFAVASRRREIGLLRLIGATPRQVRRMILGEAFAVALVAALTGAAGAVGDSPAAAESVVHGTGAGEAGAGLAVGAAGDRSRRRAARGDARRQVRGPAGWTGRADRRTARGRTGATADRAGADRLRAALPGRVDHAADADQAVDR
ncbi:FtsX-like permease family protein [Kribbella pittospori]|uniref:FtsX-like permease family protein n=1 Tax=Kribbella pittospori TaxID=722689 RepID=UPI00307C8072